MESHFSDICVIEAPVNSSHIPTCAHWLLVARHPYGWDWYTCICHFWTSLRLKRKNNINSTPWAAKDRVKKNSKNKTAAMAGPKLFQRLTPQGNGRPSSCTCTHTSAIKSFKHSQPRKGGRELLSSQYPSSERRRWLTHRPTECLHGKGGSTQVARVRFYRRNKLKCQRQVRTVVYSFHSLWFWKAPGWRHKQSSPLVPA